MSYVHDQLAFDSQRFLLASLRHGSSSWATTNLTCTTGLLGQFVNWPRPDIALNDPTTGSCLALEFKPPNQSKREYVTGIGQAITYLDQFEFSGLILPRLAGDGFPISQYVTDLLSGPLFAHLPIALFEYEKDISQYGLILKRPLCIRSSSIPHPISIHKSGRFWAYWRDLSSFDVHSILLQMLSSNRSFGDAFRYFWDHVYAKGKARGWDSKQRKAVAKSTIDTARFRSEQLNARLAFLHIGLIDTGGDLTEQGGKLALISRSFEADTEPFLVQLAGLVLIEGKHLDLLFWLDDQQKSLANSLKTNRKSYEKNLESALVAGGVISSISNPTGKAFFLRDELKLWNKLRLLNHNGQIQYFFPGEGIRINWRRVISSVNQVDSQS